MIFKNIFNSILDFIYPCECEICSEIFSYINNPFICIKCFEKNIKYIRKPFCSKCGKPLKTTVLTDNIKETDKNELKRNQNITLNNDIDINFNENNNIMNTNLNLNQKKHLIINKNNNNHYNSKNNILCYSCENEKPFFDILRPVLVYDNIVKKLIQYYKYKNYTCLSLLFNEILYNFIMNDNVYNKLFFDVIIPVPLNKKKLKERGFNQSFLIAKHLGKKLNTNVSKKVLIRSKYTKAQYMLKKTDRIKNLHDAFKLNKKHKTSIKNKNILLIDDISTTNTTINECSRILQEGQPKKIYGLVLAHGL